MALAIELAAGLIDAYGIRETKALLDDHFELCWEGRRTAQRHQTLSATLDWSYDLLSKLERLILCRLSVFPGIFTLEAARSIAADQDIGGTKVIAVLVSLVGKSLVTATSTGATTRYRLLDTTRAYAAGKLVQDGGQDAIKRRHAVYYCELLERTKNDIAPCIGKDASVRDEKLGNARAALEWSFSQEGDAGIGILLAAASVQAFEESSLLVECHRWTEHAIRELDDKTRGTSLEMELQAALGQALMFTRGNNDEVGRAFERSLSIAERLNDLRSQLRILGRLHFFHTRRGNFQRALTVAQRSEIIANRLADPVAIAVANSQLGSGHYYVGNHIVGRVHLQFATKYASDTKGLSTICFGVEHRNIAGILLAHTLLLQGFADQAVNVAWKTVEEATCLEHPVALCIALIWGASIFLSVGDLVGAEECLKRVEVNAERHSLSPYYAAGVGLRGELSIKRNETEAGIGLLRRSLEGLQLVGYASLTAALSGTLAENLVRTNKCDEALSLINKTVLGAQRDGDVFNLPELLRVKGVVLASMPRAEWDLAESVLLQSLNVAKDHSSLAWELRTATSLARLWLRQNRLSEARDILWKAYERFTEGFDNSDLKAARRLLDQLESANYAPLEPRTRVSLVI
jgi:predicted ATPase